MSTVVVVVFVGRVTFFFPGKVCQFGSFYLLETDEYFLLGVVGVGGVIQKEREKRKTIGCRLDGQKDYVAPAGNRIGAVGNHTQAVPG